jgi:hypothetical protein
MDPACGCGNFLIIAYRELRELELAVLKAVNPRDKHGLQTRVLDISSLSKVDVDQFYGIELEEFPVHIAEVAMWLVDHQMNIKLSQEFGQSFVRLPLRKSAKIVKGNALTVDWKSVIAPEKLSYIVSNPPFIGSKMMEPVQRKEIADLFPGISVGVLDYVCGWYAKAAQYMKGTKIKSAFVSTNSITQGEQVGILWHELINKRGIHIHFAHRTFKWTLDTKKADGMKVAAVYVVIIGFAVFEAVAKKLFEYETVKSDPHEIEVKRLNPYLVDGDNTFIFSRSKPLCTIPDIGIGNKPIDGGYYLFTVEERDEFLKKEPAAKPFFRRWLGADEFINGYERWCLWLGDVEPSKLRSMPLCMDRIDKVRRYRLGEIPAKGKDDTPENKDRNEQTKKLAATPTRFHVENIPIDSYLIVPEASSEKRHYIPIGFENSKTLASNLVKIIPDATPYHFGILTSAMHMAWVSYICGRLKSDYRYSKDIVYNNFPWPEPTAPQKKTIEQKAQAVLDARAKFPASSLADLYDPNAMPPALLKAHHELDRAVDAAYRKTPFRDERARIEYLFELYRKFSAPLEAAAQKYRRKKKV